MQLRDDYNPQDLGYRNFFTNNYEGQMVAMQFARANNKMNNIRSDYLAPNIIKESYISGAIHFGGTNYTKYDTHCYFDLDMKEAYPTWLLNYKRGNFNYKVGGSKRYFNRYSYFSDYNDKKDGVLFHRISFAVKTNDLKTSRLYRHYLIKSSKVNGWYYSKKIVTGTILIPDILGLPNRFLDEIYGYEDYDVKYEGTVETTGNNSVYINEKKIIEALNIKNDKLNPLSSWYKEMLTKSTGYLAHADKLLYFTMINHIRMELLRLIDYIDRYNKHKKIEDQIQILSANTDGITVYAHKDIERVIESFLAYEINNDSVFTFVVKDIYSIAHETPNDVRRGKVQWQENNLN